MRWPSGRTGQGTGPQLADREHHQVAMDSANRRKAQAPRRLQIQQKNGELTAGGSPVQAVAAEEDNTSPAEEKPSDSSQGRHHMSLQEYLRLAGQDPLLAKAEAAPTDAQGALDLTKAAEASSAAVLSLSSSTSAAAMAAAAAASGSGSAILSLGPLFLPYLGGGGGNGPAQSPYDISPSSTSVASAAPAGISSGGGGVGGGNGSSPSGRQTLGQCADAVLEEASGLYGLVQRVLRGLHQPALADVQEARSVLNSARLQLQAAQQALAEYETLVRALATAQQHQMAAAAAAVAAAPQTTTTQAAVPLASLSNHGQQRQPPHGQPGAQLGLPPAAKKPRKDPRCQDGPEKDWVDPDFVPSVTADGKYVILSEAHPAVKMTSADYNEFISRASGSATRHLRILMKHFFSQGTLARSSLTGNGQYKEVLDENLTMGIRDYIQHRYPKLKAAKINLCCTDVCVQARRVMEKQARATTTATRTTSDIDSVAATEAMAAAAAAAAAAATAVSDGSGVTARPLSRGSGGARDSSPDEDASRASSQDLTPDLNPDSLSIPRLHPIDPPLE